MDANELLNGLRTSYQVYLTQEENQALIRYFDEDGSGDIDFTEFVKKINLGDM